MADPSAANSLPPTNGKASIPPAPASSHRLPTVSASQALQDLQDTRSSHVSSGLRDLDATLSSPVNISAGGGFERGKVTEIWGSSGAGKTAVILQAAVGAGHEGSPVTWLDAKQPLSRSRLDLLESTLTRASTAQTSNGGLVKFHAGMIPTLSHLLAVILHPHSSLIPPDTALLVVDGLNVLLDRDYPRYQFMTPNQTETKKWQAGRRYAILGSLVTALNKLAVLNNLAVVVTTGCATRSRSESGLGAALVPGIGGSEWDSGIWNRLTVFQDFAGRFVGVQKCQGKSLISREEVGEVGKVIGFHLTVGGAVRGQDGAALGRNIVPSPAKSKPKHLPKRSFDEVADSEDEDVDEYGWMDSDEHALNLQALDRQEQSIEAEAAPE